MILWQILAVVAAVALDQFVKLLVVQEMALGQVIEILPFLALLHARNEGIAFSMFAHLDGVMLALLSGAVMAFVIYLWASTAAERLVSRFGFALIVGGAIGNLIDRLLLGYVVDYVYFHTPVWSFAVFNLADAFITIGAGMVILDEFVLAPRKRRREESAPS